MYLWVCILPSFVVLWLPLIRSDCVVKWYSPTPWTESQCEAGCMKASSKYFFTHPFVFLCPCWSTLAPVLPEDSVECTFPGSAQRRVLMMLMMIMVTYNSPWSPAKWPHFSSSICSFLPVSFWQGYYIISVYSVEFPRPHFFGKPLFTTSWDEENPGSDLWLPPPPSLLGAFLWQNSCNIYLEVGAYLGEKKTFLWRFWGKMHP
jgi:hypothetical protein